MVWGKQNTCKWQLSDVIYGHSWSVTGQAHTSGCSTFFRPNLVISSSEVRRPLLAASAAIFSCSTAGHMTWITPKVTCDHQNKMWIMQNVPHVIIKTRCGLSKMFHMWSSQQMWIMQNVPHVIITIRCGLCKMFHIWPSKQMWIMQNVAHVIIKIRCGLCKMLHMWSSKQDVYYAKCSTCGHQNKMWIMQNAPPHVIIKTRCG